VVRRRRFLRDESAVTSDLLTSVRRISRPLREEADLTPLIDRIGTARVVLLGEASHGTHDYYTWRAAISRRLIEEKGFRFIGVEGDWPDCYHINRYVKHYPDSGDQALDVLDTFQRWPTWMWANEEIAELAEWLRGHNDRQPEEQRVGFYGLDVYSLWDSLYQIMGYLQRTDAAALEAARRAFRCFEPYGEDAHEYSRATAFVPASCQQEVVELLRKVRADIRAHPGDGREEHFVAEQNALVLQNAEAYYRTAIRNDEESWNIRDRHMAQTLERLLGYHGPDARAIVWEHNTHIGDARFTDMSDSGMMNLGQLVRERHGEQEAALVGFGSHRGSVIAAAGWDEEMETMPVPEAREESWEEVLHRVEPANRLLFFERGAGGSVLNGWRGQRAIGVVYHPEYEHLGNYVPTVLPRRYDAFLFLDQTEALRPLHPPVHSEGELPETYPSGV
jgi:erythromycin esterase-like protein